MPQFNRGKFKELVLHLSQASAKDEGFGMVKLNKLLYRADFEAFRLLGRPITGEEYEKQEFGPVARDLPIVLDELASAGYVLWQVIPSGPYTRKVPAATPEGRADLREFSEDELEIISRTLEELRAYGGKAVSEWSHEQSSGWRAAKIGQRIPYGTALISTDPLTDKQMKRAFERAEREDWASIVP
jgi:uncharacterized phage-associated protein